MSVCTDCRGSGTVQLLTSEGPCAKCGGTGQTDGAGAVFSALIDDIVAKANTGPVPHVDFTKLEPSAFAGTVNVGEWLGAVNPADVRPVLRGTFSGVVTTGLPPGVTADMTCPPGCEEEALAILKDLSAGKTVSIPNKFIATRVPVPTTPAPAAKVAKGEDGKYFPVPDGDPRAVGEVAGKPPTLPRPTPWLLGMAKDLLETVDWASLKEDETRDPAVQKIHDRVNQQRDAYLAECERLGFSPASAEGRELQRTMLERWNRDVTAAFRATGMEVPDLGPTVLMTEPVRHFAPANPEQRTRDLARSAELSAFIRSGEPVNGPAWLRASDELVGLLERIGREDRAQAAKEAAGNTVQLDAAGCYLDPRTGQPTSSLRYAVEPRLLEYFAERGLIAHDLHDVMIGKLPGTAADVVAQGVEATAHQMQDDLSLMLCGILQGCWPGIGPVSAFRARERVSIRVPASLADAADWAFGKRCTEFTHWAKGVTVDESLPAEPPIYYVTLEGKTS